MGGDTPECLGKVESSAISVGLTRIPRIDKYKKKGESATRLPRHTHPFAMLILAQTTKKKKKNKRKKKKKTKIIKKKKKKKKKGKKEKRKQKKTKKKKKKRTWLRFCCVESTPRRTKRVRHA